MKTTEETEERRIASAMRLAIHIRDEFRCGFCARDLSKEPPANLLLDHLAPVDAPDAAAPAHLLTVCPSCLDAHTKSGQDWHTYLTRTYGTVGAATVGAAIARAVERQLHRGVNLPLARAILAGQVGEELSDTQEPEE